MTTTGTIQDFPTQDWIDSKNKPGPGLLSGYNLFIMFSMENGDRNIGALAAKWRDFPVETKDRWTTAAKSANTIRQAAFDAKMAASADQGEQNDGSDSSDNSDSSYNIDDDA